MPARSATRSTRTSGAVSQKPSSGDLKSRASTATATRLSLSSSAAEHAHEGPDNALRPQVCAIFRDAQRTTASHRKLAVKLRKLQERCCDGGSGQAAGDEFEETTFNNEVVRCVLRVMPVKKSESAGEKTIRFVGMYMRHAQEKDNESLGDVDENASAMPETPSARLIDSLMEAVLPLLMSKDRFVRYRSTQLISHVINSLDALDDDVFQKLRQGLLRRVRDKEAMVRAQAVLGLGRLAGNQTEGGSNPEESEEETDAGLLAKLLSVLQNDPSADVRRSLLVNLPILPNSLPFLLERARDQDAATRRAVYSRLLPALGDFRHLSLSMREKLLRWGLRDRDENVRKAAQRLFRERWIEDCVPSPPQDSPDLPAEASPPPPPPPPPPDIDGLLELLERIDVVNSGVENGVALEAMRGFWDGRPDYRDALVLDDQFWETLSAESVFLARSFNDFCRNELNGKLENLADEKLPEVTRLAFYIERYIGVLVEALKRVAAQEGGEDDEEEDTAEQEFIVEQLLYIALTVDYSDEVGRRKMFALLRQTLSIPELPDEITRLTIDVLRDICAPDAAGEKEFCSVVLEAVADVHDTVSDDPPAVGDGDESFHSARSEVSGDDTPTRNGKRNGSPELSEEEAREKAIKEIMVNMKCLYIVQSMLQNVGGSLQHNDHLVAMLNNLVVPAVRSHEAPVRERGLVCLGLCSLLDRSLAEENLTLFMHFFTKGHPALQITALHILTDILNVHGAQLLQTTPTLVKVYVKAMKLGSKAPEVQATATTAVSKLLLGRVVTDPAVARELLKTLVVTYFDPSSAENQSARQALNYFLPVFCFSRPENQDLMRAVALDAIHALFNVKDGLEDDDADVGGEDMISLTAIGACLVDWTDSRKCYSPGASLDAEKRNVNGDVHLDFATDILSRLRGSISKDEKKVISGLLGKLYISPGSTQDKIRQAYADVSEAVEDQIVADTTGRNALYKIHVSLGKIVNALVENDGAGRRASRSVSVGSVTTAAISTAGAVDRPNRLSGSARVVAPEMKIKEEADEMGGVEEEHNTSNDGTILGDSSIVDDLLEDGDEG